MWLGSHEARTAVGPHDAAQGAAGLQGARGDVVRDASMCVIR